MVRSRRVKLVAPAPSTTVSVSLYTRSATSSSATFTVTVHGAMGPSLSSWYNMSVVVMRCEMGNWRGPSELKLSMAVTRTACGTFQLVRSKSRWESSVPSFTTLREGSAEMLRCRVSSGVVCITTVYTAPPALPSITLRVRGEIARAGWSLSVMSTETSMAARSSDKYFSSVEVGEMAWRMVPFTSPSTSLLFTADTDTGCGTSQFSRLKGIWATIWILSAGSAVSVTITVPSGSDASRME
mmetsp:Transcript_32637/g.71306  ORF Transcript_32637/g.71306 Transcript_32637/m.71306 type:complete len:241 (-) Transcript_32637:1127-1849(-)